MVLAQHAYVPQAHQATRSTDWFSRNTHTCHRAHENQAMVKALLEHRVEAHMQYTHARGTGPLSIKWHGQNIDSHFSLFVKSRSFRKVLNMKGRHTISSSVMSLTTIICFCSCFVSMTSTFFATGIGRKFAPLFYPHLLFSLGFSFPPLPQFQCCMVLDSHERGHFPDKSSHHQTHVFHNIEMGGQGGTILAAAFSCVSIHVSFSGAFLGGANFCPTPV